MADYRQVTTEDVLEAVRRRRPLCDVNRALNVFLEPRNPFEPERTRKPKREAVIFGTLVAVVAAAFLFFNLAAPRLQVYP